MKEFYSNVYDPKDGYPKQCMVWGKTIRFDAQTLNDFLGTPVIIPEGEQLTIYSQYLHTYPDHKAIAAKLYTSGGQFILNAEGAPWKILRKDLTTLAQMWSILSYFNLAPTSHTSDLNVNHVQLIYGQVMKMDLDLGSLISFENTQIAQSISSWLGFPTLITTLCDAKEVTFDSLTFELLSPMINLAYIWKNC